jgi:hypothetical protein
LTIPGDRTLERRIHNLFRDIRIKRELFADSAEIEMFIDIAKNGNIDGAFAHIENLHRMWLEKSTHNTRRKNLAKEEKRTGWDGSLGTYKSIYS